MELPLTCGTLDDFSKIFSFVLFAPGQYSGENSSEKSHALFGPRFALSDLFFCRKPEMFARHCARLGLGVVEIAGPVLKFYASKFFSDIDAGFAYVRLRRRLK